MGRLRTKSRQGARASGAALASALALAATALTLLASPASAAAEPPEQPGFHALGRTVVSAVVAATRADHALYAIGDSLAMMEARERVEARAEAAAKAAAGPTLAEIEADPSLLPPASAGSNGTAIPRHDAAKAEKIFARSRGEETSILLTGIALAPAGAPEVVKAVIDNANAIVGRPRRRGGGHGSFYSYGYDCSGSVSFALFGGGLIPRPLTSGELEGWGAPGPGKWITVYANAGHTYAEIAGLRFDTSGTESGTGPRWHLEARPDDRNFVVRHPPGF